MKAHSIRIELIDVFAKKPYEGNPAGVVLNSTSLTKEDMQRIAREINVSNTAFLTTMNGLNDIKVRFFTPEKEIGICGHSTIATLYSWATKNLQMQQDSTSIVTMETNVGILPVYLRIAEGSVHSVTITLPAPSFTETSIDGKRIADALNISDDLLITKSPFEIVYDGLSFLEVRVRDLENLLKIEPSFNDLSRISQELGIDSVQVFTLETVLPDSTAHSRTFFPALGVNEDPVCGTGNAALASYLVRHGLVEISGPFVKIIGEQGYSVSRPGIVTTLINLTENTIARLRIRGTAVPVLDGTILLRED